VPTQLKKKRQVTRHRALERNLSQRPLQSCDECLETFLDVLVHVAYMMRDCHIRNKSHQSATRCFERQQREDHAGQYIRFQNASKHSAVPPGSGTIHRASRTTYRPQGDTQEPLRCQSTPVSAIAKQPPLPHDLFRLPANPCKTLRSASICFILLCRG